MFASTFPQVTSSPSLIWVIAALGFHLANIFLGLFMVFMAKDRKPHVRAHLSLYIAVMACLACFLVLNGIHSENTVWEYLVGVYFLVLIPWSKRWDILLHALVTVVGLTLLPLLILLQMY